MISFIKEIALLEGGSISLQNRIFGEYEIEYILCNGIIKDRVASGTKYSMVMKELDFDYILYVFNEINNVRYTNNTIYNRIIKSVNNERGSLKFINTLYERECGVVEKSANIEMISYKEGKYTVNVSIDNVKGYGYNDDIYFIDIDVIEFIDKQINNFNYI